MAWIRNSTTWSRRTLRLRAAALAAVVIATLALRLAHVGGPNLNWPLIILGAAALGALFATIQTLDIKARQARQLR